MVTRNHPVVTAGQNIWKLCVLPQPSYCPSANNYSEVYTWFYDIVAEPSLWDTTYQYKLGFSIILGFTVDTPLHYEILHRDGAIPEVGFPNKNIK